jgi:hypothetical protein
MRTVLVDMTPRWHAIQRLVNRELGWNMSIGKLAELVETTERRG